MLDLEITGDTELEAGLHDLGKAVADTKKPAEKASEILSKSIGERMEAGGRPAYPDIKPASRRARKGDQSAPALIDTGGLLAVAQSTLGGVRKGGVTSLVEFTPDGLVKGVEGPSVLRLQNGFHGTNSKGRKIDQPARPFMEATAEDESEITKSTDGYVQRLVDEYL